MYNSPSALTYDGPSRDDIGAEEFVGGMDDSDNKPDKITPEQVSTHLVQSQTFHEIRSM